MPRSGRIAALAALALTLVAGRDDPLAGRIAGTPVRCIGIGLVQGPTIAWSSSPFAAKEILSVALSFRLN